MSSDDISAAQSALERWPEVVSASGLDISDACRRLLDALSGFEVGRSGWRDVAALVRQVLLIAEETYGGDRVLAVPNSPLWPTAVQWEDLECQATRLADGRLSIRALDWEPPATPEGGNVGRDAARRQVRDVYKDVEPNELRLIEADPFWKEAHRYPTYRGEPQRQAARAAVLNDEGSLVICLPTGRGKTAVAWSKVLLSTSGVTVIVVPTVVLALDMERRTQELARERGIHLSPLGRYAYVGSLDADTKAQLREAVRSGSQRLLYTSPEAFVSGLAPAMLACAEAGLLQQVVIDEAHLVDQWGTDFRPEFQTMPGLIRDAYANAPQGRKPSVLLLSATLAQRPVDLLTTLFSVGDSRAQVVWGSELRTEPAYFIDSHTEEDSRLAAVLKAVSCLPRPLVLYVTRVEDATAWLRRLNDAGFNRVGAVTGKSSDEQRRKVMEQWRGSEGAATGYDIVVGTSAFGLGLDMPNVRTVIHACLPETIDRYYQEVGRSGRDGRPSVAYLSIGPGDHRLAERLSDVTMIGDEVGWKRWEQLRRGSVALTELRFRVRKSELPEHLDQGYGRSAAWNVRTLTLMAQAGIIELRVPQFTPDPLASVDEVEEARAKFFEQVEDYIEFELKNGEHLSHSGWTSAMGKVRDQVREAQRHALTSSQGLASGAECVGRRIAKHYRVSHGGGLLITQPSCRGCPSCRRDPSSAPPNPAEPVPSLPEPSTRPDPLARWRGDNPTLFVWYDDGEDVEPLLVRMAQREVRVFAGLNAQAGVKLQRAAAHTPIVLDDPTSVAPLAQSYSGPVAFILDEPQIPDAALERNNLGDVSYILGPKETPNPDRPGWSRRDAQDSISVRALMKEL
ncbi:protein DpdF [Microbacterium sp. CPCC 204701]|uniref:protein DpdF n=1 Tax=Microbacterium sp. CPCC 204701 TaxID=2493084 RepID=UPI000FDCA900|nr:protein DpdF [Microbacterium sp. CPCC 204701]